jgi:dienelactone hydrolase
MRALLCVLLACLSANVFVLGQTLVVQPQDGMMDERLYLSITHLKPRQPVIVRASTQDAEGKLWQSYAGFYADKRGTVNLKTQAPVNGTYTGVDSMGLVRSMNLPGIDHDRARFTYKRANPLTFRFSVEIYGKTLASTDITRRFIKPEAKMIDVRENGLVGTLFMPAGEGAFPGIIVLGGSEGGLSSEDVAALLSSHGYAALALAYFAMEGLPQSLEEIPVEYFKRAIDWMLQRPFIKAGGIALFGTSKGAEAALLVASNYKEVRAVVAYVPSGVVWSCICATPDKSSWSFEGKPVTFIPQSANPTYRPPQGFPVRSTINYKFRLRNREAVRQATIPVERINGPILLISARDDQLWPSSLLAQMVMDRLKNRNHHFANYSLVYKSAGHLIGKEYLPSGSTLVAGGRLETGGTIEGNARAQEDSWPRVLNFLKTAWQN